MNFTRMLGSLVIKKHVVCRRSLAQLFLCSGVGCVATWIRCQARGRTRCTGAREPAPAVARRQDWPLVRAGTSPSLPRRPPVLSQVEPGAGQSAEAAIKGQTLPVAEGGGGFAGTKAESLPPASPLRVGVQLRGPAPRHRVRLNVGGTYFVTARRTLFRDPKSFLYRVCQADPDR